MASKTSTFTLEQLFHRPYVTPTHGSKQKAKKLNLLNVVYSGFNYTHPIAAGIGMSPGSTEPYSSDESRD